MGPSNCIDLTTAALFVGALLTGPFWMAFGAWLDRVIRPRGHRLPSTAYFNRRNDTEPKLREWTPDHAKGAR